MKRILVAMLIVAAGFLTLQWLRPGPAPDDAFLLSVMEEHLSELHDIAARARKLELGSRLYADLSTDLTATTDNRADLGALMRRAGITVAWWDDTIEGVFYVAQSAGIGVSGSASGLIYYPGHAALPSWATKVANLRTGLNEAAGKINSDHAMKIMLVRPINEHWAIFAEIF